MTSPNSRHSRRVKPPVMVSLITELSCVAASRGLSSGQTIGAARTAVRSACCLPELRGANRLRRLYPLDDGELFKFNLKSSVCQRQTGSSHGQPALRLPLAALDPGLRGTAAQGARGKAGWPGFYRHSATDLAVHARGSDPQPQSSSLALLCQILVSVDGCRSLTACGGCAHWATVNFSNFI